MAKKRVDPDMSAAASAMGKKGGPARAKALTAQQRKQIAETAARKRWDSKKKNDEAQPG